LWSVGTNSSSWSKSKKKTAHPHKQQPFLEEFLNLDIAAAVSIFSSDEDLPLLNSPARLSPDSISVSSSRKDSFRHHNNNHLPINEFKDKIIHKKSNKNPVLVKRMPLLIHVLNNIDVNMTH
jgi:hypothetical protein